MKASNWIQQADQAMIRAADRARALAARTHTPLHLLKDGKIVKIMPSKEELQPAPVTFRDEPGISIVREDTPPYGSQKP